jgi:hypothetical protein
MMLRDDGLFHGAVTIAPDMDILDIPDCLCVKDGKSLEKNLSLWAEDAGRFPSQGSSRRFLLSSPPS